MPKIWKELTKLKWRSCPACAHCAAAGFSLLLHAKAGPRWKWAMQCPERSGLRRRVVPWGIWGLLCQTTLLPSHHHNRRFKSYHWIQHSFVVLPSPWMCKCKGIPVYLWLYYGNLRLCVGDVFLGQDFWAWLIVLGTASSLGIVTCSRDVVISSDLCSILGQETEKLLLCQLQPAAIVALVRKGQCPRAFWPVSDSSIEPLATSNGDPFDFRRPFLSWIITLSSSWMLWLQTCKQTMRLSCNCKGSNDSW